MPSPAPSSSHRSLACSIVFTHARSAAYIGCSGSIASGMPARARVAEQLADAVAHHFARAGEILRFDGAGAILRQPADDEYQAARAEGERLVDRAPVVVLRRAPAFAVRGREHPAAAIAGDRESGVADAPRRVLQPGGRHLVPPGRDAANAVAGASGDDLRQRPLLPHRRGVERKEIGVGFVHGVRLSARRRARSPARGWSCGTWRSCRAPPSRAGLPFPRRRGMLRRPARNGPRGRRDRTPER